jgi:hypothetical protein
MAQDSSSTETAPQERTGLSSNPADYLTGPTSAERRSRQGGTTRDGGVAYATDSGTSNEQTQQVEQQTQQQQTGGGTPNTSAAQGT